MSDMGAREGNDDPFFPLMIEADSNGAVRRPFNKDVYQAR